MKNKNEWVEGPTRRALSRPAITVLGATSAGKGGRKIFNLATIERIAERLAGTSGERPLLGRLKYLRGMDFPAPAAKGRGTKALLGLDETVQTLFVLELMHAGTAPTRAIRIMRTNWANVKAAIAYGWSRANNIGNSDRPYKALVLAPSVLTELGGDDRGEEALHEVVGILSFEELSELQGRGDAPKRMLVLNTQAFAEAFAGLDEAVLGVPAKKFAEEMRMFCAEAFGSTKPLLWDV